MGSLVSSAVKVSVFCFLSSSSMRSLGNLKPVYPVPKSNYFRRPYVIPILRLSKGLTRCCFTYSVGGDHSGLLLGISVAIVTGLRSLLGLMEYIVESLSSVVVVSTTADC